MILQQESVQDSHTIKICSVHPHHRNLFSMIIPNESVQYDHTIGICSGQSHHKSQHTQSDYGNLFSIITLQESVKHIHILGISSEYSNPGYLFVFSIVKPQESIQHSHYTRNPHTNDSSDLLCGKQSFLYERPTICTCWLQFPVSIIIGTLII